LAQRPDHVAPFDHSTTPKPLAAQPLNSPMYQPAPPTCWKVPRPFERGLPQNFVPYTSTVSSDS
jgi:hypothetical protein